MERLVIQVYLDTVKEFLHKFAKGFLKKYRLAVLPQGKVKYCKLLNLSVHLSAVTRCVFWAKLNNRIFGDYSLNWQWQPWQDHKSYITALDVEFYIQQYERYFWTCYPSIPLLRKHPSVDCKVLLENTLCNCKNEMCPEELWKFWIAKETKFAAT